MTPICANGHKCFNNKTPDPPLQFLPDPAFSPDADLAPIALKRDEFIVMVPELLNEKRLRGVSASELVFKKFLLFIHLVASKTVVIKDKNNYDEMDSAYIRKPTYETLSHAYIARRELQRVIGSDYLELFDKLRALGILNRAPYEKGKGFRYGFQFKYRFMRFKLIVIEEYRLMNKIRTKSNTLPKTDIEIREKHFCELYNKTRFSIDFNEAENNLFDKYFPEGLYPLQQYNVKEKNIAMIKFAAYHSALQQMAKLLNGDYHFVRNTDHKGKSLGRFYNPFTLMNKEVRGMVFLDGEKLIQLDLKNGTPYLLSNHLPSLFKLDYSLLNRLCKSRGFINKYIFNQFYKTLSLLTCQKYKKKLVVKMKWAKNLSWSQNSTFNENTIVSKTGALYNSFTWRFSFQSGSSAYRNIGVNNTEIHDSSTYLLSLTDTSSYSSHSLLSERSSYEISLTNGSSTLTYSLPVMSLTYSNLGQNNTEILDSSSYRFGVSSSLECHPLSKVLLYMCRESLETLMNREFDIFREVCIDGQIYDQLIPYIKAKYGIGIWSKRYFENFSLRYDGTYESDRKLAKKLFISMLYAQNSSYVKIQEAFANLFPVIQDLIFEIKVKNYKELTIWGFETEAALMVDKVARVLINRHRIEAYTIHDCIMVKGIHQQKVRDKISEVFMKRFGNEPMVAVD